MPWGVAAAVVGGVIASDSQRRAGNTAADAQRQSSQAGISEQQRQFDAIQALLQPYVQTGQSALNAQAGLIGLGVPSAGGGLGPGTRQATPTRPAAGTMDGASANPAIAALQNSPYFQALTQQGENAILQNASATGGLRGGNTQAALAQFRPALLEAAINDQYSRLGGLSSMGLGAATQTGNFGQASTNNVSQLLQQQGAAQAGAALSQGRADVGMWNSIGQGIGAYYGMGARRGVQPVQSTPYGYYAPEGQP